MHKIKAKICQMLFPNADAIVPKRPPNSSIVFGASVAPVKVPTAYFKIHPITTVYPIAIAREPRTGIIPNPSPTFLFPFFSQTIPNASIGPDLAARPKLISPITPVDAITTTKIKYGIKKEPPPYKDEGTEKVDYTVYIWYNVSIKYRRCFYDRTTAEIDAKSIHGNI